MIIKINLINGNWISFKIKDPTITSLKDFKEYLNTLDGPFFLINKTLINKNNILTIIEE
jgi:hypothetical protein